MLDQTMHFSSIVRNCLLFFKTSNQNWQRWSFVDSGHGGQTKDLDGDEADGYDEVIYPVDYKTNGHIVDDVRW